ncbi:MAG: phosphate regulon transcriptional regulatory protein PhoB [Magnetococcales bacterium]|nr:phosphate regulon transcriptional regulator PhoB [Magnetococcales bacterium]NGZ05301.1 phosphate regulon transcriptional regulatory protein PhoB [Magnetococcales bacterium]
MRSKVLIVDDESAIRDTICLILANAGFESLEAASVLEAQGLLRHATPNLILLDWMLKGVSGIEYLRLLKKEESTRSIPVIMLTAKGEEHDKVSGLEQGADDYITKPFSAKELLARIRVALRRVEPTSLEDLVEFEGLVLDRSRHAISSRGTPLKCSAMEYRLLGFFITHPDRVYHRDQLLDLVWGRHVHVGDRTVDVHVRSLRKLLEPFGQERLLQTVRGAGYMFSARHSP